MKCAILPGVYVGEFSLNGFVGFAVKEVWQRRTTQIESILRRYSMAGGINMFCRQCGKQIREGATFCPNCGTRQVKVNPNAAQQQYNQQGYAGGGYAQPNIYAGQNSSGPFDCDKKTS